MKIQHTFLMAMMGLSLSFSACNRGAKTADTALSAVTDTLAPTPAENVADSIDIRLTDGAGLDSAHVRFLLPCYADKHLNAAILEQISEELGGSYQGSYDDAEAMARHYLSAYMQEMRADRKEFDAEMGFERNLTVERTYETDQMVTFNVQMYQYTGGAHGGTICYGLTFRKSDGRRMSMNTLGNQVGDEEWSEMQKEGLMEYFEVKTDSALQENLQGVETYMIPQPQYAPYFSERGMEFVYQQYEIACYAAGLPSYTIPYNRLGKYLNVTGKRLLGK